MKKYLSLIVISWIYFGRFNIWKCKCALNKKKCYYETINVIMINWKLTKWKFYVSMNNLYGNLWFKWLNNLYLNIIFISKSITSELKINYVLFFRIEKYAKKTLYYSMNFYVECYFKNVILFYNRRKKSSSCYKHKNNKNNFIYQTKYSLIILIKDLKKWRQSSRFSSRYLATTPHYCLSAALHCDIYLQECYLTTS